MLQPHEVLGIEANADEATINSAFRRAAKRCHPDLHGGDAAGASELKLLIAARDRLINRNSKKTGRDARSTRYLKAIKYAVPAAIALSFGFGLVLFATLKGSRAATETAAVSQVPVISVQRVEASDPDEAGIKLIRDWQEGYDTGESNTAPRKRLEARRNHNGFPGELEKAANGAVALLKDLRHRVLNR